MTQSGKSVSNKLIELKSSIMTSPSISNNKSIDQIFNGSASQRFFERVAQLDETLAILLVIQLLLFHCYFQLDINSNGYAIWFLRGGQVCGVMGCFIILIRYFEPWSKTERQSGVSICKCELLNKIIMCLIMPYEFIQSVNLHTTYVDPSTKINTEYHCKLNYLLIILACFRVFYFSTVVLVRSQYMSPRSGRICKLYGAYPGFMFCLRSIFKDNPFCFVTTIFFISVLMFTFAFRVAEQVIYTTSPMTTYTNMLWMTVITMTTVGYGDYNPKTQIGRMIAAACVSWGVLIVSVMVVVLTQAFAMNRSKYCLYTDQSQTLNILKRLEKHAELRQVAGLFLRESVWRMWKNHKNKTRVREQMKERKLMLKFRHYRRLQSMASVSESQIDFYNQMTRQFERAFINLENLTSNNLMIINYLNEQYIFKGNEEEKIKALKTIT